MKPLPHREIIVLIGKPGSGKGTQAQPLSKALGIPAVSIGKLYRKEIAAGTALGKRAAPYVRSGKLVPDKITIQLLKKRFFEPDTKRGIIIDGTPRTLEQALELEKIAPVTHAIYISITDREVHHRLSMRMVCIGCGKNYHLTDLKPKIAGICDLCQDKVVKRDDDTPEIINARLEGFRTDIIPVLRYYRNRRLLRRVDGMGTLRETNTHMLKAVWGMDRAAKD